MWYSFLLSSVSVCHQLFAAGFNNIISFSLKLDTKNITGFFINDTMITDDEIVQDAFVSYNVKVYCCYMNSGCGSVLVNGSKSDASDWRLVIDTNGDIDFSTYEVDWSQYVQCCCACACCACACGVPCLMRT